MASHPVFFLCSISYLLLSSCSHSASLPEDFSLESLRVSLERQEDFIIFSLIERARYPYNSPAYQQPSSSLRQGRSSSLAELFVMKTEAIAAQFGRYQNPEELPFFPDDASATALLLPHKFDQILRPSAASVNVSKSIWNMYFNRLLPLLTTSGDDGNYQQSLESDLICLQALSKRIHYGRFVSEMKFRANPQDFIPAIQAQDSTALNKLVTFKSVEEATIKRVSKKAKIFGQDVIQFTRSLKPGRFDDSSGAAFAAQGFSSPTQEDSSFSYFGAAVFFLLPSLQQIDPFVFPASAPLLFLSWHRSGFLQGRS
ncbi:Chorismate mutase 2 [Apostasia shenzhenica]|uniref:chorismate mutase n=1 Tax=Apostasia shenzhenica TaxID=1088818 RepID=A0A2I0BCH4_9ASPA|nr:Chorismate mutase 2 [Apostasia shenzhenica]